MATARSLNPSFSVPSRHGVMDGPQHREGPEATGFLERSVREEAASCGREKTWERGFRARMDGHRSCAKSRGWFSGNTYCRRSNGCEWFVCESIVTGVTRVTCARSALLQVKVACQFTLQICMATKRQGSDSSHRNRRGLFCEGRNLRLGI